MTAIVAAELTDATIVRACMVPVAPLVHDRN